MSKYTEVELKLTCTDHRIWKKIMTSQVLTEIAIPESKCCQTLEAHYFDTPEGCLQKAKLAYRIRREGEQWVATVKDGGTSLGGLHERQEWNIVVNDLQPDISIFSGTDIGKKLIEVVNNQALMPILMTRFERTSLDVIMPDGSQIEVAADEGIIIAGSQSAPILEVELELKAGQAAAVIKLGSILGREYPLLPESESKFYRGLKLAGLAVDQPAKSLQPIQVDKHVKAGEGLRVSLVQLILQVLDAQEFFLKNQTQRETLHELRIALRRLRSFLEFSKGLLMDEQYQWYQTELRKLGQSLGLLRDVDVAHEKWDQCCELLVTGDKTSLGETLAKYRLREVEKLHKALHTGSATALLLDLWAILIDPQAQEFSDDHLTVEEYAVNRLSNWIKTVAKQGNSIDWTNTDIVHKIRLQVKKIKYVAQVFEPVRYEIPQFILLLDTVQEKLGLLTDYASTDALFTALLRKNTTKAVHLEIGMMIGWSGCEKRFTQRKMDKYWKKLHSAAQRWKWNKS